MFDKELRHTIGSRAKERRKGLGLSLQYVADRMDVSASTIQRYENGSIDNTKKLIVEGLAEVLHVAPEWLRGETDEMGADVGDELTMRLMDTMHSLVADYPLRTGAEENEFSKKVLLLLLMEYERFNDSFTFAVQNFSGGNEALARELEDTPENFNSLMFMREITHTVNLMSDVCDALRTYSKDPGRSRMRIDNLLGDYI